MASNNWHVQKTGITVNGHAKGSAGINIRYKWHINERSLINHPNGSVSLAYRFLIILPALRDSSNGRSSRRYSRKKKVPRPVNSIMPPVESLARSSITSVT